MPEFMRRFSWIWVLAVFLLPSNGRYRLRPSNGAGQTRFSEEQRIDSGAIAVLPQYHIEALAQDLPFRRASLLTSRTGHALLSSGTRMERFGQTAAVKNRRWRTYSAL